MRCDVKASLGVGIAVIFVLCNVFVLDYWEMRPQKLKGVTLQRLHSSDFQVVENGSAFVYSAYIDDRPAKDFTPDPNGNKTAAVVRIFAYFLRTIDVRRNWKCLFWYADQDQPIVTNISNVTDLNVLELTLRFLVAMVICDLPDTQATSVLQGVSLVSSDSNHTNLVDGVDIRQSTSTLLNHLNAMTNVTFTVCTSPIHGNYYKINDIVNFIEVNRILGAERFVFYFNQDIDLSVIHCLETYRDRGIVEMYEFTPPVLNGLHYHGQILSITECVYRTMYRTKYLINQDIDEVIVPVNASDWKTLLNDIHTRVGPEKAEKIAAYSFRNQFFPLEAPDDRTFNQTFLAKRYDIKPLLKTQKEPKVYPHHVRSKVMARPERILIWHVHLIYQENLIQRNYTIYDVAQKEALLHHYRSGPTSQNFKTERRMHRYASLMTERIHFGMGVCSPIV